MRDTSLQPNNGIANSRIIKMMGLRKQSKLNRQDVLDTDGDRQRTKVILVQCCQNMFQLHSQVFNSY